MATLKLQLLGGLRAHLDDSATPIVFPRRKAAAVLAYLAMSAGEPRSREWIADLLWAHTGEEGARNNLRQTLHVLRRALPGFDGLGSSGSTLALCREDVRVDVTSFEDAAGVRSLECRERAIALYAGDFLEGFGLREEPFEAWRAAEAARLRDMALAVLEGLLGDYERVGRHADAIAVANRALGIDPLHEPAHLALVRAYAATGRAGLARRQEQHLRDLMAREHGVRAPALSRDRSNGASPARDERIAAPGLISFRHAPTVAVMPIGYREPAAAPYGDALTARLIAVLAKALPMTIVDHRTATAVASEEAATGAAAEALGASYAVEGSVLSAGSGQWLVEISLIDVGTGRHLWTESMRFPAEDVADFASVAAQHLGPLAAARIEQAEWKLAALAATGSLDAWQSFQRGMGLLALRSVEAMRNAQPIFDRAVSLEPSNARVLAGLSAFVLEKGICLVDETRDNAYPSALEIARRAHELDRDDWFVHWHLGRAYQRNERFESARDAMVKAQQSLPGNLDVRIDLGNLLSFMGQTGEGIELFRSTLNATERSASMLARSHLQAGHYEAAVYWARREHEIAPENSWAYVVRASALGHLGRREEGRAALMECERRHPGRVNAEFLVAPTQYRDPHEHDHVLAGVGKAGWVP